MQHFAHRIRIISAWAAILALGVQSSAWSENQTFERIFIFGDSLSDPGNLHTFLLANTPGPYTSQAPYTEPVPSFPYDIDGYQFSNGKTWAQWFARHMEMKRSGQAAIDDPGTNGNYALGGARVGSMDTMDPTTTTSQVERYLGDFAFQADSDALYVIQFGANDVRDALGIQLGTGYPGSAQAVVENAVVNEIGIVFQLYQLGARHFLVANVPNISITPVIRMYGEQGIFAANLLVGGFNSGLETGLQGLEGLPGISIDRLDFHTLVTEIYDDPGAFGLKDASSSCLMFMMGGGICSKPNKFLFWDGIHPTAKIHKIVSKAAARIYD